MRKTTRFVVTTLAILVLFSAANTAAAGEPEEAGFVLKPMVDFFRYFVSWF